MTCTIPQCRSRVGVLRENEANISFHRFPADPDLKKLWTENIRNGDEWSPSQHTRICSLHFEKSCYREGYGRKFLHSFAVPTIFPKQPWSCKPGKRKKRKLVATYSGADNDEGSTSTATDIEGYQICILESKVDGSTQTDKDDEDAKFKKMRNEINKLKILASRRGKKLKTLQRQCSRLRQKNSDLEIIIHALHQ